MGNQKTEEEHAIHGEKKKDQQRSTKQYTEI